MTVSSTTSRADSTGNGVTTAFPASFRILDQTHIVVLRTQISTGVVTTLALTTDYTVSGVGGSSFTVTCVTPPTADQRLSILRNVPLTQLTDYVEGDAFPAASHEDALDKLTMQVQQLDEAQDRALTLAPNSTGISSELPAASANALIGWNAAANALVNYTSATSTPVTAFMETLLDDTTAAAARATLAAAASSNVREDVASAATLNLDSVTSDYLRITGTTTVPAVTLAAGQRRIALAGGAFQLTNGASLIVQGGADYTTTAGDLLLFIGESGGVVRVYILKADGTAIVNTATNSGKWVLVDSDTASSSASIALTGYDSAIHGNVRITGKNVTVSTDGAQITLRTSTNGGSSYDSGASDYRFATPHYVVAAGVSADGSNGTNAIPVTSNVGVGNAAGEFCNFELSIPNPGAASPCAVFGTTQGITASGASFAVTVTGCRVAAADVDAFQFVPSAGSIAGGAFELWALLK